MHRWLVLMLTLALTLAACSGGTEVATQTTPATSVAQAPPATPTEETEPSQPPTPTEVVSATEPAPTSPGPSGNDPTATSEPEATSTLEATASPTTAPTEAPPTATSSPAASATRVRPTVTPTPTSPPEAIGTQSWMENSILFGEYGRSFGVAPVLGRLGLFEDMDDMARDVEEWEEKIRPYSGGKRIRPAIHLIYGMATACEDEDDDCLLFLDSVGVDIVEKYIKPAQERGWLVFLDTQHGRSDSVTQVQRMIEKGYLKYDNVQVALDPEFHVEPGQETPGIPIGSIPASQVNAVSEMLSDYVRANDLRHSKILLVHSFNDDMIRDKGKVETYPGVDLVITADGIGSPELKTAKYNVITSKKLYPFIQYRGIKLFPEGPSTSSAHADKPLMTFGQVFGEDMVTPKLRVNAPPDVIIMT